VPCRAVNRECPKERPNATANRARFRNEMHKSKKPQLRLSEAGAFSFDLIFIKGLVN
jgi:hypothetical protein